MFETLHTLRRFRVHTCSKRRIPVPVPASHQVYFNHYSAWSASWPEKYFRLSQKQVHRRHWKLLQRTVTVVKLRSWAQLPACKDEKSFEFHVMYYASWIPTCICTKWLQTSTEYFTWKTACRAPLLSRLVFTLIQPGLTNRFRLKCQLCAGRTFNWSIKS